MIIVSDTFMHALLPINPHLITVVLTFSSEVSLFFPSPLPVPLLTAYTKVEYIWVRVSQLLNKYQRP